MNYKPIVVISFLLITCSYLSGQTADFATDTLTGCGTLTVQFSDLSTDATSWEWDFDDDGITDSQLQNPSYTYTSPGLYSVTLRINSSVSRTKTDLISVLNVDPAFWYTDTLEESALTYVFRNALQIGEPTINYQREWSFANNFTSSGRIVIQQFPDTGTYQVVLNVTPVDLPQCAANYSRTVKVSGSIHIPNVFTPNGDAVNDFFIVEFNGTTPILFNVYSRFGNLVYKSKAPMITWDGKNLSGNDVSPGVYYYVLSSENNAINESGFLHLFR